VIAVKTAEAVKAGEAAVHSMPPEGAETATTAHHSAVRNNRQPVVVDLRKAGWVLTSASRARGVVSFAGDLEEDNLRGLTIAELVFVAAIAPAAAAAGALEVLGVVAEVAGEPIPVMKAFVGVAVAGAGVLQVVAAIGSFADAGIAAEAVLTAGQVAGAFAVCAAFPGPPPIL